MNRRHRRAHARKHRTGGYLSADPAEARRQVDAHRRAARELGAYAPVVDLPGACSDCTGTGDVIFCPDGSALGLIRHEPGCPAARGIVTWQPVAP